LNQRRSSVAEELADIVGAPTLALTAVNTGWPSTGAVHSPSGVVEALLYVGPITLSKRERDDVERRFQNPGQDRPIEIKPGAVSLLLGLDKSASPAVIIGFDAYRRVGALTRFSLFMPVHLLDAARSKGWAEHFSDSGERIVAFVPTLFPTYVEAVKAGVHLEPSQVQRVVQASGLLIEPTQGNVERGRGTVSRLIREQRFSGDVRSAYDGRCAMCGLDHLLVVGAHIYPAAAPGSQDEVWNGLALCHNHHAAFDGHSLHVDARSRRISLHPDLLADARKYGGAKAFVDATFKEVVAPSTPAARPPDEVFDGRYRYFESKYNWVMAHL
jgi:hypothetical protein